MFILWHTLLNLKDKERQTNSKNAWFKPIYVGHYWCPSLHMTGTYKHHVNFSYINIYFKQKILYLCINIEYHLYGLLLRIDLWCD